jgi:lyso-ornithine lipid O-acyltransferase
MDRAAEWPALWPSVLHRRAALAAARLVRFGAMCVASFLLLILPQLIWMAVRPRTPSPFARLFLRSLVAATGLRVDKAGEAPARSALLLANHISWTDILVLGGVTRAAFVARADVRDWPVLGLLARLHATIFIDRSGRLGVRDQSSAVADGLKRGRVMLFPEGTTGDGSELLPFRPALLAAAGDRPIQPVAIAYAPREARRWRPGELADFAWDGDKRFLPHLLYVIASGGVRCRVTVLPPLPAPCRDRKAGAAQARAMIRAALQPAGP